MNKLVILLLICVPCLISASSFTDRADIVDNRGTWNDSLARSDCYLSLPESVIYQISKKGQAYAYLETEPLRIYTIDRLFTYLESVKKDFPLDIYIDTIFIDDDNEPNLGKVIINLKKRSSK